MEDIKEEFLTVEELSERLKMPEKFLVRSKIPRYYIGKCIRFRWAEVLDTLKIRRDDRTAGQWG